MVTENIAFVEYVNSRQDIFQVNGTGYGVHIYINYFVRTTFESFADMLNLLEMAWRHHCTPQHGSY